MAGLIEKPLQHPIKAYGVELTMKEKEKSDVLLKMVEFGINAEKLVSKIRV